MKHSIYPAIFHKTEENGYWVEFPDLPGCLTEADTLENAYNMAGDALFVWMSGNKEMPSPSSVSTIKAENDDFVSLVKAEPYESEDAVKFLAALEIENGLEEKKLNKSQAAQILGVDRSYFTYLISGKKVPSPDMAKRIGLLLGFDWRIFYADKSPNFHGASGSK